MCARLRREKFLDRSASRRLAYFHLVRVRHPHQAEVFGQSNELGALRGSFADHARCRRKVVLDPRRRHHLHGGDAQCAASGFLIHLGFSDGFGVTRPTRVTTGSLQAPVMSYSSAKTFDSGAFNTMLASSAPRPITGFATLSASAAVEASSWGSTTRRNCCVSLRRSTVPDISAAALAPVILKFCVDSTPRLTAASALIELNAKPSPNDSLTSPTSVRDSDCSDSTVSNRPAPRVSTFRNRPSSTPSDSVPDSDG